MSIRDFIENHWRNEIGGSTAWIVADPAALVGKTVAESFQLDDSGYVIVCTDHSIYRLGHRIVEDGDWPEFEQFIGICQQKS